MEFSNTADYHNAKNKRRLVQQNIRLRQQLEMIQVQVSALEGAFPVEEEISGENPNQPLLQELAMQERVIRQLRARIEGFRLERAKDNVEYIIHEEDDLKIAKQLYAKLVDERDVLAKRTIDKRERLQHNLPYQNYEKQFLEGLTEVVHHNREQAAKVTEIEREIRKYHLIAKNVKSNNSQSILTSPQELHSLENQINQKQQQKRALERQWKPHLDRLDDEYAKLLKELASKKEVVVQLQREEKSWETRMLSIRSTEAILEDRKRLSQVIINPKLKQQLQDYLLNEEEKKKKKVNSEELKYQFKSSKEEQEKAQNEKKKIEMAALPPSLAKKKEERIIEITHDDKNISKKIERLNSNSPKKAKVDQMHNTDLTVPANSDADSSMNASKQKMPSEDRSVRLWQVGLERQQQKIAKEQPLAKEVNSNILRLKEVKI